MLSAVVWVPACSRVAHFLLRKVCGSGSGCDCLRIQDNLSLLNTRLITTFEKFAGGSSSRVYLCRLLGPLSSRPMGLSETVDTFTGNVPMVSN